MGPFFEIFLLFMASFLLVDSVHVVKICIYPIFHFQIAWRLVIVLSEYRQQCNSQPCSKSPQLLLLICEQHFYGSFSLHTDWFAILHTADSHV